MRSGAFATALSAACFALSAAAQPVEPAPATPVEAVQVAAPSPPRVHAGTPLIIEITETISSKTIKRGDKFTLKLAAPIVLDDRVIVPAGVTGVGQVIDAAPSGALGKPAKLLLAARYIDFNGGQIPLRTLQLGKVGTDKTNTILAISFVPYVGLLGLFMHGGEIEIPAGTIAQVKLVADLDASPPSATPKPTEETPK